MSGHTPSVSDCSEAQRDILMLAEMTKGSNHTQAKSKKGSERSFCALCKQQRPKCEKICHFSGTRTKNQRDCFATCLTFCFKDQTRMEQSDPLVGSPVEGTEERLRELTKKWFLDTQVPLIIQNGLFPTWFLGFITRKDAEEILCEKELGCFLIRLSNKAIGYILSYKGRDRCRHFVINQSKSGQFLVHGDNRLHNTVSDLIEHYKTSPIQPFGEHLTTSCFEALNEELYDIIQVGSEEKPLGAVRNTQKPQNSDLEQPPSRPPRSNRTLNEAPPLPQRSRNLDGGLHSDQHRVFYAQLRKKSPSRMPYSCQKKILDLNPERSTTQPKDIKRRSPPPAPQTVYSELGQLDSKSRSLPVLDRSADGEQSYRLSSPPEVLPRRSPRPVSQLCRYNPQPVKVDPSGSIHSWENMSDSAVYYLAGQPGSPHTETRGEQRWESVYAEVTHVSACEPSTGQEEAAHAEANSNTYEPVENIRPKQKHLSWALKNEKLKWLFPETKRK